MTTKYTSPCVRLAMVLLCTASFVCGTAAGAASIYVNQTGWWNAVGDTTFHETNPGQIQAAIASASAGNTIFVYNGSYSENMEVSESLTLRGEGADMVTITAADSGDHVFFVTAGSVNIFGFTVTGAGFGKAGIHLDNQTFIGRYADHCNISDNNCSKNYRGIWLYKSEG